jgi:hypothetical protein
MTPNKTQKKKQQKQETQQNQQQQTTGVISGFTSIFLGWIECGLHLPLR